MSATCNHGYEFKDCKICYKAAWQCDHGTCCRKATLKPVNSYGEVRPACAKHAKYMGTLPSPQVA